MLTHIHMVVYTWWCWHIYKEGGVCRGEMGLGPSRENRMPIFYCAGCKFLWLAHWSKGEEVRSENELIAKMLASVNWPDAGSESTGRWLAASGQADER